MSTFEIDTEAVAEQIDTSKPIGDKVIDSLGEFSEWLSGTTVAS